MFLCHPWAAPSHPMHSSTAALSKALPRVSLPLELHPRGRDLASSPYLSPWHHPAPCVQLRTEKAENTPLEVLWTALLVLLATAPLATKALSHSAGDGVLAHGVVEG